MVPRSSVGLGPGLRKKKKKRKSKKKKRRRWPRNRKRYRLVYLCIFLPARISDTTAKAEGPEDQRF